MQKLLRSGDIYTSRIFVCCLTCFVIICLDSFVSPSDSLSGAECVGSISQGLRVSNFVDFPVGAISTATVPTVSVCHLDCWKAGCRHLHVSGVSRDYYRLVGELVQSSKNFQATVFLIVLALCPGRWPSAGQWSRPARPRNKFCAFFWSIMFLVCVSLLLNFVCYMITGLCSAASSLLLIRLIQTN